jgi:predicted RNase H-like HicB family nuclease
MQYQIFVEDQSDQHFVASVIGMPNIEANGNTELEAVSKAEAALRIQLAKGKIVTVEVDTPLSPNSFIHAGIFQNDPTFDDWMERLAEIRRQANEVDDYK